jgi:asparagine synthase (glutamine-hydrolysing)
MQHEPFYSSGTYSNASLGVSIGWTCIKGAFSDCLPIWNEGRDICLLFTGDDFADPADIAQLKSRGHSFAPNKAEYLVHRYEQEGIRFLENLNGGFAGVLIDLREGKLVLFNDRYGLSRLYFHENKEGVFFASEAKALLQALPELRRWDLSSLGEFFSCGCALQNRTLFAGISLMPGGSAWTFEADGCIRKRRYFRREEWEQLPRLTPDDYYETLKETWRRVLPRYFRGNETAGLSLTGGVDSRMILAWAGDKPGRLPCYTFGGIYRDCADVRGARALARLCKQSHQVIQVAERFLSEFPGLAEKTVYISDGAMDVTGAIDLYVQRIARTIAPVRVTGTNGGEILRRLVAFKPSDSGDGLLEPEMATFAKSARFTYERELEGRRLSFTAFKQTPWFMCSKFSVESSQLILRMPYFDNELVALSYQAPRASANSIAPALRLIAEGNPTLGTIETDRGLAGQDIPGVRFVRHLMQQFTFKAEYAYDYGMPQWLARLDHVAAPLRMERLFLGRHKFHHFRVYYRDHLFRYVREILLDSRTRDRCYLRGDKIEEMVNAHIRGSQNFTLQIHKILTTELVHRLFLDKN